MKFQSTRPRGARRRPLDACGPPRTCFNPRARAGRDLSPDRSGRCIPCCFNPRARAGRDCTVFACHGFDSQVSIHAPARGATFVPAVSYQPVAVSIHAPARGATSNPDGYVERGVYVSIHAPARGATTFMRTSRGAHRRFQSTRPRGARRYIHGTSRGAHRRFQSTRPRGARLAHVRLCRPGKGFQSTRPRGARQMAVFAPVSASPVSIHAPARGAT